MNEEKIEINPYFFNLVTMFASAAWQQLGKMQSQIDGKIHKDLKSAQLTIDMLLMLRDKTKGNLIKKEEELLTSTISNLQINYADEAAKPAVQPEEKKDNKEEHKHSDSCGCSQAPSDKQ
ncbi:MAG: DUF1844 domain-containing protein [Endomicrobium sp.]|jgi:hypothetical protein|nr:DUF1844 domain-containing protein [Endomicrobium sp.]